MVTALRLKRTSHSPSPFSWDSLTIPRCSPPLTEAQVAELPSPPTSWLSARDMKIFGVEPLRSDIGVVRCSDCDKPVLRTAISDHASEFNTPAAHKASQSCVTQQTVTTYDRARSGSKASQQMEKVSINPLSRAMVVNSISSADSRVKEGQEAWSGW